MRASWIDGSIREFESFWSVIQRFIMLNAILPRDFSEIYFQENNFKEFSTNYASNCFKHQTFRQDLRVSQTVYDHMTLNSIEKTFADQTVESLKYCPICINSLYHSIYFQIKWVSDCPIHKVKLLNKCHNCGRGISVLFNRKMVHSPYCCTWCLSPLYTDKNLLLNPPIIEESVDFKRIANWCRYMAKIAPNYAVFQKKVFNSSYMPEEWFYPLYKEISEKPLPNLLKSCKELFVEDWKGTYKCGLKSIMVVSTLASSEHGKVGFRVSGVETSTYTAIFKSYRRYLIKKELGRYKRSINSHRKLPSDCSPTLRYIEIHEKYVAIRTLIRRMDQYHQPERYWFLRAEVDMKKFFYIDDTKALQLCKNAQEVEWVSSHILIEELKSLYTEALVVSKEMIKMGVDYECWPLKGKLLPCSFVYRDQKNEQLIFKCIQNRLSIQSLKVTSPYNY